MEEEGKNTEVKKRAMVFRYSYKSSTVKVLSKY